ncbi:MAG: FtsK/SpoIIIE domain-containing protein [Anaerolineales bacterium]|nr:FtsK/SpoIIIE domain-containing protein [Anaerolineales bacterium]MDW8279437.1 FtsK/SpoIIIE domain-containing protein [Anaerolineales bacterium]
MSASSTVSPEPNVTGGYRPRLLFTPAQRKPWRLPEEKIELPLPPPAPSEPAPINLPMSVIPPVIMIGGSLVYSLVANQGSIQLGQVIPVIIMSLGFPLANVLSVQSQRRKYRRDLEARRVHYRETLARMAERIERALQEQVETLRRAYPSVQELASLNLRAGEEKLWSIWARRRHDPDFMALRLGEGNIARSFAIEIPRSYEANDPLYALPAQVAERYSQVKNAPVLLELDRIGSVVITGNSLSRVHGVARRLTLDAIVHHSPEDLQIFVFAEGESLRRWEWLKWLSHTDALRKRNNHTIPHLAFSRPAMERALEWLEHEYEERLEASKNPARPPDQQAGVLVILDEDGSIRQTEIVRTLAAQGVKQRIYLLFVAGRSWPRECHAELRLYDNKTFELIETHQRSSLPMRGTFETAAHEACERIARLLAGLEAGTDKASANLPESVRIGDVLGTGTLSLEAIQAQWQREIPPAEQLTFPIGLTARGSKIGVANLTLLPDEILGQKIPGGLGAYHTILIGTTGSGKSEFMKSVVLGAATRYPPSLLNFFFMDFKGGAAFGIYENLPHVSGAVTNLRPELVERGLDSIVNEIERRQREFDVARKAKDIWEYNYRLKPADKPLMPHLILFLDEFARGLRDFPRLREPLDLLVRQGRSLGMYLVLANQDVNAEVERLLSNVGWRIALPVSKQEDLNAMIGRNYRIPDRKGRGYLRQGETVLEFQAGYAGHMVRADGRASEAVHEIYRVEADGIFTPWATLRRETPAAVGSGALIREEELIVNLLQQATLTLSLRPASKIYLNPLENRIALMDLLEESGITPVFSSRKWLPEIESPAGLQAVLGKVDMPRECLQTDLVINLDERDGHLWIVGPGSGGKEMALSTLIGSLALCYTPETCQFYFIDAANDLAAFEKLPHTGALIRARTQERERFERLMRFLSDEMEKRLEIAWNETNPETIPFAHLVLVINNVKEVRNEFDDEKNVLERIVRDGSKARIHLVLTTNRAELPPAFRNNIARRLVLGVSNRDEHADLVGASFPILEARPGRGYSIDGATAHECQIAFLPQDFPVIVRQMSETWQGSKPRPIRSLPTCIPLSEFPQSAGNFPVGRCYDSLEDLLLPAEQTASAWLIVGKSQTGKSNFLACAARGVLGRQPSGQWNVRVYALKRSVPLFEAARDLPQISLFRTVSEIEADVVTLLSNLRRGVSLSNTPILLLVDDAGALFKPEAGLKTIQENLNALAGYLETTPGLFVMAAEQYENLQPIQFNHPFIRVLKQNQFGMAFSKEQNDLMMLGLNAMDVPVTIRRMSLPPGRGIFVRHARWELVQTPLAGECPKRQEQQAI